MSKAGWMGRAEQEGRREPLEITRIVANAHRGVCLLNGTPLALPTTPRGGALKTLVFSNDERAEGRARGWPGYRQCLPDWVPAPALGYSHCRKSHLATWGLRRQREATWAVLEGGEMPIDTLLSQAPGPGRLVDEWMTTQEITGRVRAGQLAGCRRGGKAGTSSPSARGCGCPPPARV